LNFVFNEIIDLRAGSVELKLLAGNALRFWSLDRFPFLVFYRVQGDELQVLRILHERRDIPTAWMVH
jgi:toxin ParE1/3/4